MGRFISDGQGNYYIRRGAAEEESGDKTYNIQAAMAERYGIRRNIFGEGRAAYSPFGPGYEAIVAPTTQPSFPRARVLGYNRATKTLVIIFRDGKWVMYTEPVEPDFWEQLQVSNSTGKYLKYSNIDSLDYKYVYSADDLPRTADQNLELGQSDGR